MASNNFAPDLSLVEAWKAEASKKMTKALQLRYGGPVKPKEKDEMAAQELRELELTFVVPENNKGLIVLDDNDSGPTKFYTASGAEELGKVIYSIFVARRMKVSNDTAETR